MDFSSCVMKPMRYAQDQNLNFLLILVCFSIPLFSPFSEVNHQAKVWLIFSAIEIGRNALDVPYFGILFFFVP